jgi:hypothetical protein
MVHKKSHKRLADTARADVVKEMAKPRMSRSARIAELNRDATRIPELPSTTMPGTVNKIIKSPRLSQPEKAQISVAGADRGYRSLRIENILTDEHGDDVRLKRHAHVEVTVTAEPKLRTASVSEDDWGPLSARRDTAMPDEEWIKALEDGRMVKFIYQQLPEDAAFLTAQIAGNEVVYSVVLTKAGNPLTREDVESHFASEFSKR